MDPTAGSSPRARPPGPEPLHTPYQLAYLASPPRPAGGQPDIAGAAAARSRLGETSRSELPALTGASEPLHSSASRPRPSSGDGVLNTPKRPRLGAGLTKARSRHSLSSDSSASSVSSQPSAVGRTADQPADEDQSARRQLSPAAPPPSHRPVFKMKRTGGRPGGFTRPSNPRIPPDSASASAPKGPPRPLPLPSEEVLPIVPSPLPSPRPRIFQLAHDSQDSSTSEYSDAENDAESDDSSSSSDEAEDDGQSFTSARHASSAVMDDDPDASVSGTSMALKTPRSRAKARATRKMAGKKGSHRKSRRPYRYKMLAPSGGLKASASGRSYQVWDDGSARPIISAGALFPDGYQKGVVSNLPWICPIRSCRELFLTVGSLSKHWMDIHRCCILNDNGDGTFSIKGRYAAKPGSWKKLTPAIVISQKPLDPGEPPMPAPHRPTAKPKDAAEVQEERGGKSDMPRDGSSRFAEILMASPQREYGKWRGPNGILVDTKGILIPVNYKLFNREEPWVCPVRSCRLLFPEMAYLRKHFTGEHWGCLLNDNGDGTFSITKSSVTGPARVVSKNPLDADAPPPAEPQVNSGSRKRRRESPAAQTLGATPSSAANSDTAVKKTQQVPSSTGTPRSLQNTPAAASSAMKTPAAASSTAGRPAWSSGRNEGTVQDPMTKCRACAQTGNYCLNGDESAGFPCDSCRKRGARCNWNLEGARVLYTKKAAALFPDGAAAARNATPVSKGLLQSTQNRLLMQVAPSSLDGVDGSGDEAEAGDMDNDEVDDDESLWRAGKRRMRSLFRDQSPDSSAEPGTRQNIVTLRVRPARLQQILHGKSAALNHTPALRPDIGPGQGASASRPGYAASSSSIPATQTRLPIIQDRSQAPPVPGPSWDDAPASRPSQRAPPSDMPEASVRLPSANDLEMEDWEVAPGRIRAAVSEMPENIAFSNPYLTSNQNIIVDESLSFRVEVIHPGQTRRFEADGDVVKVCSLGAGKLRVRIEGEPEFAIGPSGMFKIKPGVSCAVENRIYVDSVLHISSVHKGM